MANSVGVGFPSTNLQRGHTFHDLDEGSTWIYISGPPRLASSWRLLNGVFSSQPDTTLWGLTQAGASWFNSSDRTYYGWNGSEIVPLQSGLSSSFYDYRTMLALQDDFVSGASSNGTIGTLSWFTSGGSSSGVATGSAGGRPGVLRRDCSAVGGTVACLLLSGTQGQIVLTYNQKVLWICRLNQVDGNTICRIGMTSSGTVDPINGSGAFFEKAAADTNWFCVCYAGGVASTRVNTGLAIDTNFHDFMIEVRALGTIYDFYLDGVLVGSITVGIPTVVMQPATQITNNSAAAAKTLDHDYFQLVVTGISRGS